jgi:hypothetical protein
LTIKPAEVAEVPSYWCELCGGKFDGDAWSYSEPYAHGPLYKCLCETCWDLACEEGDRRQRGAPMRCSKCNKTVNIENCQLAPHPWKTGLTAMCNTCFSQKYFGMNPGQQAPVPNDGPSIHDLVTADIEARKTLGLNKYGTLLQAHNGRRGLKDVYEELLDAVCYLRQVLEETK